MHSNSVIVRVNALPLGSQVEIEMNCDSERIEWDKLDKLWKNFYAQKIYKSIQEYEAAAQDKLNPHGEIYYLKDAITVDQLTTRRGKSANADAVQSNILGVTSMIPVLEIIEISTGTQA